jgi:hypothetical protein
VSPPCSARCSGFFGAGITSYEWVYVVPAARVEHLVDALGGDHGGDVLALLAAYYGQHGGQLGPVLSVPRWGPSSATGIADNPRVFY